MSEWQPISTAPKDGAWFLAGWWDTDEHQEPLFVSTTCQWLDFDCIFQNWGANGWIDGVPTHWQALPKPPKP